MRYMLYVYKYIRYDIFIRYGIYIIYNILLGVDRIYIHRI